MRDKKWAVQRVLGSRVQVRLQVVFFAEFICSDTILPSIYFRETLISTIVNFVWFMKNSITYLQFSVKRAVISCADIFLQDY